MGFKRVDFDGETGYSIGHEIAVPKGANEAKLKSGQITNSMVNKLHLIKVANDMPYKDSGIAGSKLYAARDVYDLCQLDQGAVQYDVDDFLYCQKHGMPINRMITLRRFPMPCTDNIWDMEVQGEPDIARMVTYFDHETNKLEELLGFSYKMEWRELKAEFEQANMQGEQSGLSGYMKKAMKVFDPELYKNDLRGENARMLDPKADGNKTYGPVDSLITTYIRDVGLTFTKEFEITFEYELRSINGRTPEYAMKDLMANILACTYNNGKFWPGARFWVGERPSKYYQRVQYMNSDSMDEIAQGAYKDIKSVATSAFGSKSAAIDTLKQAITGGAALAMGKILDTVGRPGILAMNSLLSAEPTGFWHLMIGDPTNPTLCIGNLIIENVTWSFPSSALSYGNMPTKLVVKINLKPGQSKDNAGIEMMFNQGKHRIYYAPKSVAVSTSKSHIGRTARGFFGFDQKNIDNLLSNTYDFIADGVKTVKGVVEEKLDLSSSDSSEPDSSRASKLKS